MWTWIIVAIITVVVGVCIVAIGGLVAGAAYFRAVAAGRTEGEALAQQRLTEVAEALTRYKTETGAYPQTLAQLVPAFLSSIPDAKPGTPITYLCSQDNPMLMYSAFIYYRRILHVATGRWSAVD